jgi:hypothetical protein
MNTNYARRDADAERCLSFHSSMSSSRSRTSKRSFRSWPSRRRPRRSGGKGRGTGRSPPDFTTSRRENRLIPRYHAATGSGSSRGSAAVPKPPRRRTGPLVGTMTEPNAIPPGCGAWLFRRSETVTVWSRGRGIAAPDAGLGGGPGFATPEFGTRVRSAVEGTSDPFGFKGSLRGRPGRRRSR